VESSPPYDPEAMGSPLAAGHGLPWSRLMRPERRRPAVALLLSLLIHSLLLSLTFGGQELGFPGFGFPWQDRRVEVPELHVVLVPGRVAAAETAATSVPEPLQLAPIKPPIAVGPVHGPSVSTAQPPRRTADVIVAKADQTAEAMPRQDLATPPPGAKAPLRANGPSDAVPAPNPEPAVIAFERPDGVALPLSPSMPSPVAAAALSASSPEQLEAARVAAAREEALQVAARREAAQQEGARQEAARAEAARSEAERQEAAQQEAARQEAARVEAARLEAQRQEAEQQAAARREAAQREAARQEAARVEAARLEAERQEEALQAAARREAAQQEAARREAALAEAARLEAERQEATQQAAARREATQQEAARQEAVRAEAARLEAERQAAAQQPTARREAAQREAARQEAARAEAARSEAERQEAVRLQAAQHEEQRREAARRAMGRQLDEEAAQREAASTATSQPDARPYSLSTARRGRLWGRTDPNSELVLYAEAWARKIEFNTTFDVVREVAKRPHIDPMVTVAIRRDGSVESVTFVLSSGVAEIDEAIRRIVQSQVPYQPFQLGLAREFDVIEIRRTWYLDVAVRLY